MSFFNCEDCKYSACEVHGNSSCSFGTIQDALKFYHHKQFLQFINLISSDCFISVCNFLVLKDLSVLDRAFVNKLARPIWNKFLEEKYSFTIVGFNELLQLKKLTNWLQIKKSAAISLQIKYIEETSFADISENVTDSVTVITTLFTSRLKEIFFEMCDNWRRNIYIFEFLLLISSSGFSWLKLKVLRLILPVSREDFFVSASDLLINSTTKCMFLVEIYLTNILVKEVNEICKCVQSSNKLLKILWFIGKENISDNTVEGISYLSNISLESLQLNQLRLSNSDVTAFLNSSKSLRSLQFIKCLFDKKFLSKCTSRSLNDFIFHGCCYLESTGSLNEDRYYYSWRQNINTERRSSRYLGIDFPEVEGYKADLYKDILMDFSEIHFPNLESLNVSFDSLITEQSVSMIIKNAPKLQRLAISNIHLSRNILSEIIKYCVNVNEISLCLGYRVNTTDLQKLLLECKEMRLLFFEVLETEWVNGISVTTITFTTITEIANLAYD